VPAFAQCRHQQRQRHLVEEVEQLAGRAEAIEQSLRPLTQNRAGDIRLSNRCTHAKVLLALDNVAVTTPDGRTLFHTGDLKVFQRDRIVVTGANGVGKSLLVRLLRRAIGGETVSGLTISPTLVVGMSISRCRSFLQRKRCLAS